MAIELMSRSYPTTTSIRCLEAASAGLQSVEKLIKLLSHQHERQLNLQPNNDNHDFEYKAAAEVAASKFKSVISILDRPRTGHARFRRGPVQKPEPLKSHRSPLRKVQPRLPPLPHNNNKQHELLSAKTINFSSSPAISSTTSSLTCDTSMSAGFQMISSSLGKPPLSANSLKRKCSSVDDSSKCGASSGRCHCSKRRKSRIKRVVRIAAVSMKTADIPSDDYSWRKYGQKPIKGSPHPRGYYRCSSVKGCPARKHVERALDEPSVLVVTYEGDHNHPLHFNDASVPDLLILESS